MTNDAEAREDWRIGVLMADGRTSYEIIHDQTETRALREAVKSAAHSCGRKGTNPPVRIASVQTFKEVVLSGDDPGLTPTAHHERRLDKPRRGTALRTWVVPVALGSLLVAFVLGATLAAGTAGRDEPSRLSESAGSASASSESAAAPQAADVARSDHHRCHRPAALGSGARVRR